MFQTDTTYTHVSCVTSVAPVSDNSEDSRPDREDESNDSSPSSETHHSPERGRGQSWVTRIVDTLHMHIYNMRIEQ